MSEIDDTSLCRKEDENIRLKRMSFTFRSFKSFDERSASELAAELAARSLRACLQIVEVSLLVETEEEVREVIRTRVRHLAALPILPG